MIGFSVLAPLLLSSFVVLGGWSSPSPFELDLKKGIPTLWKYSDQDLEHTLLFTRRMGRPWSDAPLRRIVVTAYTDAPNVWTKLRYRSAMRFARWYLRRCQIKLEISKLHVLPQGTLTRGRFLRFKVEKRLERKGRFDETFLFFTKYAHVDRGKNRGSIRLLGLSAKFWSHNKRNKWIMRRTVWIGFSTIYTTLVHELGHRMGLKHIKAPYNLMLTGSGVRSSPKIAFSSLFGLFDPARFRFFSWQCKKMHLVLKKEKERRSQNRKMKKTKKQRKQSVVRNLKPAPLERSRLHPYLMDVIINNPI